MDILGIGPLELFFVILIALIIFGPQDMVKAGKTAGRYLRKLVKSPGWQTFQQASKEVRSIPTRLMREAGLEELENDIGEIKSTTTMVTDTLEQKDISAWVTPPDQESSPDAKDNPENSSPPETEEQS